MRAREFRREGLHDNAADPSLYADGVMDAIPGALSMPDLSMNRTSGSPYMQWRFGIAMAGAPDFDMEVQDKTATGGDPLLRAYSDAEMEMVQKTAQKIGAGRITKLNDMRSHEADDVHKVSPVKGHPGYGTKNKKTKVKKNK